jgi:hypothetical protein
VLTTIWHHVEHQAMGECARIVPLFLQHFSPQETHPSSSFVCSRFVLQTNSSLNIPHTV